jgi:hypothetical protein
LQLFFVNVLALKKQSIDLANHTMDVSIEFMLGLSKFIVNNNQSTTFHFNLGFVDLWSFALTSTPIIPPNFDVVNVNAMWVDDAYLIIEGDHVLFASFHDLLIPLTIDDFDVCIDVFCSSHVVSLKFEDFHY